MDLYNKIKYLCDVHQTNVTQMCKNANIPRSSLSELKMGRSTILSTATLQKIADHFNISIDELLDTKKEPNESEILVKLSNPKVKEFIDRINTMNDSQLDVLENLLDAVEKINNPQEK